MKLGSFDIQSIEPMFTSAERDFIALNVFISLHADGIDGYQSISLRLLLPHDGDISLSTLSEMAREKAAEVLSEASRRISDTTAETLLAQPASESAIL